MVNNKYQQIYTVVRKIPPGKVVSYGQIAEMISNCTPRMVGYALAASNENDDLPWWRVVNSQLMISLPRESGYYDLQKKILENEGIVFSANGKILTAFRVLKADLFK